MISVAMIRELDRLFLVAKTTGAVADWNVYESARAAVDTKNHDKHGGFWYNQANEIEDAGQLATAPGVVERLGGRAT